MHELFEISVMLLISLNTIIMTVKWAGMDERVIKTTETINYLFTACFVLEACIKLMAFGRRYFMDTWNVFDLAIVVISLACIVF